jgi:hypothetical protein
MVVLSKHLESQAWRCTALIIIIFFLILTELFKLKTEYYLEIFL